MIKNVDFGLVNEKLPLNGTIFDYFLVLVSLTAIFLRMSLNSFS